MPLARAILQLSAKRTFRQPGCRHRPEPAAKPGFREPGASDHDQDRSDARRGRCRRPRL